MREVVVGYYGDVLTASWILQNIFIPPGSIREYKKVHFKFFRYYEIEEEDINYFDCEGRTAWFTPNEPEYYNSCSKLKIEPTIYVAVDRMTKEETIKAMTKAFYFYLQWLNKKEYSKNGAEEFSKSFLELYKAAGKTMKEIYKKNCDK